jgi:hypothetical protein
MTEFETDVLVSERRRTTRRRTGPERKPLNGQAGAAAPHLEPRDEAREQAIAERREIIDRRRQDRRRQIDPTTCERDYSDGEIEFMRAMDDYKRKSGRPFPTWSEVLEVLLSLGYRKVADPTTLAWRTFGDQMGSL